MICRVTGFLAPLLNCLVWTRQLSEFIAWNFECQFVFEALSHDKHSFDHLSWC